MKVVSPPHFPKLNLNHFNTSNHNFTKNSKNRNRIQNFTIIAKKTNHVKSLSLFDNSKLKNSRNRTSSLKENMSDSTTNASKNSKMKTLTISTTVKPFCFQETQKKDFSPMHRNENDKNEMINLNTLFRMNNYETNLLKYSQTKRIEKKPKKKINKIVYMQMNKKFYDEKVSAKTSRDKTMESEAIEMKKIIRFWKGVFDISYPQIMVDKMKYSCMLNRQDKSKEKSAILRPKSITENEIKVKKGNFKPKKINLQLLKSKLKLKKRLGHLSSFQMKKV